MTHPAFATESSAMSSSAILQELLSLRELGSVLYVAAHPDDEDTQLIAYLARGRGARTAYLSLTRGDGGQNLIGPELGDELGVLRTQELLAARRIDGGYQYFTRARDFGFSKDYAETLSIWDREQVLSDVVRVIRTFRPDIIVTAFSTQPGGTHGHHTASAILAVEAFKLAGDPKAYPDQLTTLSPWQPKRVLHGIRFRGGDDDGPGLQLEIGGYNALLGESYGEISARSRSMHRTQGFGTVGSRGSNMRRFAVVAGEPAQTDIFDGVETTWRRFPDGERIDRMLGEIIAGFDARDPSASVPALLELRRQISGLKGDPLIADKLEQLDRILKACLGLYVDTTLERADVVPGETMRLTHNAIVRGNVTVRWVGVRYPLTGKEVKTDIVLPFNRTQSTTSSETLPADAPLSHPYWLRKRGSVGMFVVDDPAMIGVPENPPAFPVEHVFEVQGQRLVVTDAPVQVVRDPAIGEVRQDMQVIAPVVMTFADKVELFAPGETRTVGLELRSMRPDVKGSVKLQAPAGWKVTPATQEFHLARAHDGAVLNFSVTAPAKPAQGRIGAIASIGGAEYGTGRRELRYPHLPDQLLQPPTEFKAVSVQLEKRGRTVGYFPGAGDEIAPALQRMGYQVVLLEAADLNPARLQGLDAVVIGVRAFNTREDLVQRWPALLGYAEQGGTVLVQYNTQNNLLLDTQSALGLRISRDRVTDETARVTLLAPEHPALNAPNRIGPADFEDWVQERGLYFPDQWDDRYTALLACNDPGEQPKSGALLVGRHGRGHLVYASLAFFRQLPEGVPGAYRLFANLLSLGAQ